MILPLSGETVTVGIGHLSLREIPLSIAERKRFWNKTVVEDDGRPTVAELVIRPILEQEGLDAVWAMSPSNFTKVWPPVRETLPPSPARWYRKISAHKDALCDRLPTQEGRRGGCWDLLAWQGNDVFFVEAKRKGSDSLKHSQRLWLESALAAGVPLSSFMIVEWELR